MGRREEPPRYESGFRALGSNQRFHRLLRHAVARALTTAPSLAGVSPAAEEDSHPSWVAAQAPPGTLSRRPLRNWRVDWPAGSDIAQATEVGTEPGWRPQNERVTSQLSHHHCDSDYLNRLCDDLRYEAVVSRRPRTPSVASATPKRGSQRSATHGTRRSSQHQRGWSPAGLPQPLTKRHSERSRPSQPRFVTSSQVENQWAALACSRPTVAALPS